MNLKRVPSRWGRVVLVCAKCSKKVGGGFGAKGRTPLAKALKKALGKGRKAKLSVVAVKCLGVCPKDAVTMVDARSPGEWLVVRAGTPVDEVVAQLAG